MTAVGCSDEELNALSLLSAVLVAYKYSVGIMEKGERVHPRVS